MVFIFRGLSVMSNTIFRRCSFTNSNSSSGMNPLAYASFSLFSANKKSLTTVLYESASVDNSISFSKGV